MKNIVKVEIALLMLLIFGALCVFGSGGVKKSKEPDNLQDTSPSETTVETEPPQTTPPETTPDPIDPEITITWYQPEENRTLAATHYFVYDCQNDTFLTISDTATTQVEPASITKLFTAYVALQYLDPTDTVYVRDALDSVVSGSSTAGLNWNDSLTAERMVEAMLLPSGNDAAYAIAIAAGRAIDGKSGESASTAIKTFVAEMNRQAAQLGMTGTHFVNPDGIHRDSHYSTLGDLAILGKLAMQNSTIMKYTGTAQDSLSTSKGTQLEWKNTNALINPESEYYCPYAIGLKTGQTPYAGCCLLSAFSIHGQDLVIGVFGCAESDERFIDTLQLLNQALLGVN